jgi:pyrroloquinoline-quinone synthase
LIETAANNRLEDRLRGVLEKRYHHLHPFNQAMHRGELSPEQIRGWIASRFYYQQNIPVKDALLLSKLPREYRAIWVTRIHTHDGFNQSEGGLEAWLSLGDAAGLEREALLENRGLLPGVRFAVDAYVNFVREKSWLEGVASSLTELSSKQIMTVRTVAFEEHYKWLDSEGLRYFRNRLSQAPKEAEHALAIVERHATTPELQEQLVASLNFKCDVLWALLDAVQLAYPE